MSVIGGTNPTLLDMAKITDPNGGIADIVEMFTQINPILMDAPAFESNLPTGHLVTLESGLPTCSWRQFNQGIATSKLTTQQVTESMGMLNGRSTIDKSLADLNGNSAAYRAKQDGAFMRSMANEVSRVLFYGSTLTDPEQFLGLTPRFNALTGTPNSANVVNSGIAAAGADQSSIWLIVWGEDTCHLIYPKGSKVGIAPTDMGLQLVDDGSGNKFLAYVTDWQWNIGLAVKDYRYVSRICNIDSSAFTATTSELVNAMVKAFNRIRNLNYGRPVFYANRLAMQSIDLQIMNKGNMFFSTDEWHGKPVTSFRGIPVLISEGLVSTESVVS